MDKSVTFRAFRREDSPYLEDIIRKTWQYDRFCSPKTAKRLARLYLLSCLARQSFAQVALRGDTPVGVIMGKSRREKTAHRFAPAQARAALALLSSREGRAVGRAFSGIDGIDQALLAERGRDYDGEACFFAVEKNCRGMGIGEALFTRLLDYMDRQGARSFYLYTDSSCNFGFYECHGMTRCGEKACSVPIGQENEMRFYLYEYGRET